MLPLKLLAHQRAETKFSLYNNYTPVTVSQSLSCGERLLVNESGDLSGYCGWGNTMWGELFSIPKDDFPHFPFPNSHKTSNHDGSLTSCCYPLYYRHLTRANMVEFTPSPIFSITSWASWRPYYRTCADGTGQSTLGNVHGLGEEI